MYYEQFLTEQKRNKNLYSLAKDLVERITGLTNIKTKITNIIEKNPRVIYGLFTLFLLAMKYAIYSLVPRIKSFVTVASRIFEEIYKTVYKQFIKQALIYVNTYDPDNSLRFLLNHPNKKLINKFEKHIEVIIQVYSKISAIAFLFNLSAFIIYSYFMKLVKKYNLSQRVLTLIYAMLTGTKTPSLNFLAKYLTTVYDLNKQLKFELLNKVNKVVISIGRNKRNLDLALKMLTKTDKELTKFFKLDYIKLILDKILEAIDITIKNIETGQFSVTNPKQLLKQLKFIKGILSAIKYAKPAVGYLGRLISAQIDKTLSELSLKKALIKKTIVELLKNIYKSIIVLSFVVTFHAFLFIYSDVTSNWLKNARYVTTIKQLEMALKKLRQRIQIDFKRFSTKLVKNNVNFSS